MRRPSLPLRYFRSTPDTHSSTAPVHRHHVHDLEAAIAASIGRNFDVLSRQFYRAPSPTRPQRAPRSSTE